MAADEEAGNYRTGLIITLLFLPGRMRAATPGNILPFTAAYDLDHAAGALLLFTSRPVPRNNTVFHGMPDLFRTGNIFLPDWISRLLLTA